MRFICSSFFQVFQKRRLDGSGLQSHRPFARRHVVVWQGVVLLEPLAAQADPGGELVKLLDVAICPQVCPPPVVKALMRVFNQGVNVYHRFLFFFRRAFDHSPERKRFRAARASRAVVTRTTSRL